MHPIAQYIPFRYSSLPQLRRGMDFQSPQKHLENCERTSSCSNAHVYGSPCNVESGAAELSSAMMLHINLRQLSGYEVFGI